MAGAGHGGADPPDPPVGLPGRDRRSSTTGGAAATWRTCCPGCSSSTSRTPASRPSADGELAGFLVGFRSQSRPGEAYIHFVGIHPGERGHGLGRQLYERFFEAVRARGCDRVRAVTSPVNRGSVAFHQRMGFDIEPGEAGADGIAVAAGYDGEGQDRVRFVRQLNAGAS